MKTKTYTINKTISNVISKRIELNKGRKAFRLFGRDYIIGIRTQYHNGYHLTRPAGRQAANREFWKVDLGYITLYRSAKPYSWLLITKANQYKHTFKSLF